MLSFPPFPLLRYSCISLSYDNEAKFTNGLITQLSYLDDRVQAENFDLMLDSCRTLWPHPLLVPVLLLNVLMNSLEASVPLNITSAEKCEKRVEELPSLDTNAKPIAKRANVAFLLERLHDTLNEAIKLLDAVNWLEKTAAMLEAIGNELDLKQRFGNIDIWSELQQYLKKIKQITDHLKPDPVRTQQRCLSQIDIVSLLKTGFNHI